MARKSKSSIASLLNVDFEVVLIIVLIVVAIMLVLFLNRKFSRERFLVNKLKEARDMEHFNSESNSEVPNATPSTKVYFFYARWCGYSVKYLDDRNDGYDDLKLQLKSNNLKDRFVDCDVETSEGKTHADKAGVTGLPSFYTFENGEFTKMSFGNGIDNTQIIEWLLNN